MTTEIKDLVIKLAGEVVESNLPEVSEQFSLQLKGVADKQVACQEDADLALITINMCKKGRDAIKVAKKEAMEQTVDIKKLYDALDDLDGKLAATSKIVKEKRDTWNTTEKKVIVQEGIDKLDNYCIEKLAENKHFTAIGGVDVTSVQKAIHNKKNFDSMRKAVADVVKSQMEEMDEAMITLKKRQALLDPAVAKHSTLYPDYKTLITKSSDAIEAIISGRSAQEESRLLKEKEALRVAEEEKALKAIEEQKKEVEQAPEPVVDDSHKDVLPKEVIKGLPPKAVEAKKNWIVKVHVLGTEEEAMKVANKINDNFIDWPCVTRIRFPEEV